MIQQLQAYFKTAFIGLILIYITPFALEKIENIWSMHIENNNKIGCITIHGSIENSEEYRTHLINFFQDSSIKAILLIIESDGGSAGSCQALALEIEQLKKEFPKPIITYTENMCTCGAYEIAASTDHIVASGSAIIGSIGSKIITICNIENFLQKHNITCTEISAGTFKNPLSSFSPTTDNQQAILQSVTDNTYQQIAKKIAFKRHLQLNKIDQWGNGKIFTGTQAYDLKLVDAIGCKTTAINLIKKNIIPSDRKIMWIVPHTKNRWINQSYNKIDLIWNSIIQQLKNSLHT
ncbi:MAG: S49 family peptidase [Candidatus Chromulinivorax sp.]